MIRYSTAADIVIEPVWEIYQPPGASDPGLMGSMGSTKSTTGMTNIAGKKEYIVPNFDLFTKLKGVETATKVYTTDQCEISGKEKNYYVEMMAVTTDEFGKVAWFRNDLLKYYWYNYLNLIAQDPSAILISSSLAVESGLKPGDSVYISWGDTGYARFTVYATIDYWPSWNPNGKVVEDIENGRKIQKQLPKPMLVVANFQYVYDRMSTEPWNIWIKLKPGAITADLYKDIANKGLDISTLKNIREELIKFRTDPFQMGINGAMTISFCIVLLICLTGFILFWMLSIKSRELQFGIFRAIGLQTRSIAVMLVLEQVLISGISVLAGSFIGIITTKVFIRFFNLTYSSFEQVPPFKIVTELQDYTRLYVFITIMLVIGLGALSLFVSRIKTAQALKLGED
ncbi:MAG: ABC transporter permease [Clostridiales bacterium]|nr:ABC transporter permease [Clostridiales bacterium]